MSASTQTDSLRVVIAGGGTGGHVFPGIAIAEAFMEKAPKTRVLFAGTGNRLETDALRGTSFEHRAISASGIKGKGGLKKISAIGKALAGLFESIGVIRAFSPHLVIGVGGYVSGPMMVAAWLCRVPRVLHEQNRMPGLANRWLAPLADRIYLTFPDTKDFGTKGNTRVTGNPVRKKLQKEAAQDGNEVRDAAKPFTVLIFGGSQGAHAINRAVVDALSTLSLDRMSFIHQTGAGDLERVRAAYAEKGAQGKAEDFFTDMGVQYRAADLVICRAGATTIAEITALGKPAIYIPYPFAADDHQRLNAESLTSCGAGEMILEKELSGGILAGRIEYFARNPEALAAMAAKAGTFGKPDAARDIVADCYTLLGK